VNKVMVKVGIPFVPSFLVAYIITFSIGNWMMFFL
jgi:prepilin signal peptidase PulO-like enzyme (type II secretory pathway)